jgi:hypothetical protein
MKFDKKDLVVEYQSSEITLYSALTNGYYQVSGHVIYYVPTGNMIEQPNPKRAWYKFWVPKTVLVQEFRQDYIWDGTEVKYLKAGDVVVGPSYKL